MGFLQVLHYPVAIIGTVVTIIAAWIINKAGIHYVNRREGDPRQHYRKRQMLSTVVLVVSAVLVAILWARLLQRTGTFLGIVGAGLAIALREPLLSVAGRIAIFAGHIYMVGDRIEINKMSGDVIDVGFFYTRMMEIGNWISGDQYSGRIIQFANAQIFGAAVFNYTRNFAYIWDEIKLPITYTSNMQAATEIMSRAGEEYSQEYLQGAQENVQQMQRFFLVSQFELKPQVYLNFDSNYVTLTMRYLADPKQRRSARNFLFSRVLERVQQRDDISFGSDTMDVTVKPEGIATVRNIGGDGSARPTAAEDHHKAA
jgi:small-conductance mechanosensitive channel